MRDSGFNFAAVDARFMQPEQYLQEFEDVLLMDCTPRWFQKARITVESIYYTGYLDVFVIQNPIVDLIFGNIESREDSTSTKLNESTGKIDITARKNTEKKTGNKKAEKKPEEMNTKEKAED